MIEHGSKRAITQKIDTTVNALGFTLSDRSDVFFTTSYGYQSALLFALIDAAGLRAKCLFVSSRLSFGGVDAQRDTLDKKFSFDVTEVSRNVWLEQRLSCGEQFLGLENHERSLICRELKREPVMEFIAKNNIGVWITGIRRAQTMSRRETRFLDVTDMGVIKVAPLADWTNYQVRQALTHLDLPRNPDYVDLCKQNEKKECGLHF